jgi:hypothetical protein
MNGEIFKKAQDYFKSSKGIAAVVSMLCIGLLLVFVNGFFTTDTDKKETAALSENDLNRYTKQLEEQLTQVVSNIYGTGNVKVMITLESSFENVFANNASIDEGGKEEDDNRTTQKQLVLSNSKNEGDVPIVIKQISPKIKGVIIVCDGGNQASIKEEIINAASVVFHVATNRIYVTGGK